MRAERYEACAHGEIGGTTGPRLRFPNIFKRDANANSELRARILYTSVYLQMCAFVIGNLRMCVSLQRLKTNKLENRASDHTYIINILILRFKRGIFYFSSCDRVRLLPVSFSPPLFPYARTLHASPSGWAFKIPAFRFGEERPDTAFR